MQLVLYLDKPQFRCWYSQKCLNLSSSNPTTRLFKSLQNSVFKTAMILSTKVYNCEAWTVNAFLIISVTVTAYCDMLSMP